VAGEVATSACLVVAPITSERPFSSMPDRPSTLPMSISAEGEARRCFMVGSSVCPPARILASSDLASSEAACRTVLGA
jgi:hypothetical protein